MDARRMARALELRRRVPTGPDEHLSGYGLPGLAFESGHALAFHRFTASNIGPPCSAVWHRDPYGRWTFHTNIEPDRSCSRWFGPALDAVVTGDVEVRWTGPYSVTISAHAARLHLALRLRQSLLTRAMGYAARSLPDRALEQERRHAVLGPAAGRALRAGRILLAGTTPSGHEYLIHPRWIWRVAGAAAVLDSTELGRVVDAPGQPEPGPFVLPARGVFAAGTARFRPRKDSRGTVPASHYSGTP